MLESSAIRAAINLLRKAGSESILRASISAAAVTPSATIMLPASLENQRTGAAGARLMEGVATRPAPSEPRPLRSRQVKCKGPDRAGRGGAGTCFAPLP